MLFKLFKRKENPETVKFKMTMLDVFDFNDWFCENKNPDIYAHKGIYLRLDKLSNHHVTDYLKDRHKLSDEVINKIDYTLLYSFINMIRLDWQKQINK